MENQLKILVDNLFDKEFDDIYNNVDLDSEIANEFIYYNVGDFIYNDKKKPYAICCADKFDFKDQKERFILFNNVKNKRWSLIFDDINFNVNNINNENGLITTNEIINSNKLKNFPAFKYCKKFGDKAYIPTCKEFEILNKNLKQINKRVDITNYIDDTCEYWTCNICTLTLYGYLFKINTGTTFLRNKNLLYPVLPFIQL